MAGAIQPREQARPLLAAANNHGDLAVKLSSLKQAKDILLSVPPSHAAELFPYLVELHSSPEALVRKYLLQLIDELGTQMMEHLSLLLPVLLALLKDDNPTVAKQSVITGTKFFGSVLEELAFQFQRRGIVERWLEELWTWMVKFRNAVLGVTFEAGPLGPKMLAIKFLETFVLQFTLVSSDPETHVREATTMPRGAFNVSWIADGHPVLDIPTLVSDAKRYLAVLLDMLQSASSLPCLLTISAVNSNLEASELGKTYWEVKRKREGFSEIAHVVLSECYFESIIFKNLCGFSVSTWLPPLSLAAIARKRPVYLKSVLAALLDFSSNLTMARGCHVDSIQFSLRTAFLGFLRCTHPVIAESRERLLRALRAMNAGDAADQVIRQIDKIMRNNEHALQHISGDVTRKRSAPLESEDQSNRFGVTSKRLRYDPYDNTTGTVDTEQDQVNGRSPILPVLDGDLTPVEQMITVIRALIAEGERGLHSLGILISNIHPDLLADIVIANMKHLPKNPPPLTKYSNLSLSSPSDSYCSSAELVASNGSATSTQSLGLAALTPLSSTSTTRLIFSDISSFANVSTDPKRDPRRDSHRLDPRRMVVSLNVPVTSVAEDNASSVQSDFDASCSTSASVLPLPALSSESTFVPPMPKIETELYVAEPRITSETDKLVSGNEVREVGPEESARMEMNNGSLPFPSSTSKIKVPVALAPIDAAVLDEVYSSSSQETDQLSPDISNVDLSDIASTEFSGFLSYVELDEEHQINVKKLALERIINLNQNLMRADFKQTQSALIARSFAQANVDYMVGMVQKHIVSVYEHQKGHELVMDILYHLHSLVVSDSTSSVSAVYEKFLLGVAKSLLEDLPASDKSFSRLLGEAPCIPESVLRLLHDACTGSHSGPGGRDGERVIQGLGAVWSLILGRPVNRQACLDVALKCAVNSRDDVRAKAIRLVANKLYIIGYISENIEQFATNMFMSAVDQRDSDAVLSQSVMPTERIGGQVDNQETSTSSSQVSEPGISQNESTKGPGSLVDSSISLAQAHCLVSLFFALCTKKPSLLQLVFDNYARAPKAVQQAVHRHIPVLIRTLESSYSELLHIISTPPKGSEHLFVQVLQVLCDGRTPTPDLVTTVKRVYETRLKDPTILIPVLSAFSRDEVLPIFPQLVGLPSDKFQTALAHILQGSAHTGPALTPVEVLVMMHDISPERDGLPLKKITDACSACFEQRTVFTHQVLSNALNQMADRNPLPLLFMRTVIQAIDAFPTMVNFVMEILTKLVHKQIWRMPKLWVGFLKCISQTQPHSFRVLLQLPLPQLESALNKYGNLRGPLIAFVNRSNVKTSLPRSTLDLLGLSSEAPKHETRDATASDPSSSGHRATYRG